jgi:preprotein translocase subunit SecA
LFRNQHYSIQPTNNRPSLTSAGQAQVATQISHELGRYLVRPWYTYVEQALHAQLCLTRDVDYVVADDTVKIVDTHTGRIFEDRSWSEGLHQAVEAKEGVTITEENRSLAGISRQQYFRNYVNLCGMTGTTSDCERELLSVYGLKVSLIPTHRPSCRRVMACRTFLTDDAKWNAIADSVRELHKTHRPVLIGTRTIESSKKIAARLSGLRFQLLNGVQDGDEAKIIACAGQHGAITIATNMAGRGTDIKLGEGVAALGGLHVIVSEPAETARVDQQLMGRAARQGDPGSSQLFVSAEDALITRHGPWMARYISKVAGHTQELAEDFSSEIARLQKRVAQTAAGKRREMFSRQSRLDEMKAVLAKRSG